MWVCPKCGREFKRTNQEHYCGDAPTSVVEYINAQDESSQRHLTDLAILIHSAVPDIIEEIKWSMPSFRRNTISIQFAACRKQVSLFVGKSVLDAFRDELDGFAYKKDALYLPYDRPLPEKLIRTILQWIFVAEKK